MQSQRSLPPGKRIGFRECATSAFDDLEVVTPVTIDLEDGDNGEVSVTERTSYGNVNATLKKLFAFDGSSGFEESVQDVMKTLGKHIRLMSQQRRRRKVSEPATRLAPPDVSFRGRPTTRRKKPYPEIQQRKQVRVVLGTQID
jgi:hypothetical protein